MSVTVTEDTIQIYVPTIPYLVAQPLTLNLPLSTFKTAIRLVVIISTYLLFRPQLERLFRTISGQTDPGAPQSVEGMRNKMKDFETEIGRPLGGGRKVAVVTGTGTTAANAQAQKARRKA